MGIFFEKENIDTLDTTGELFLTILSAMAQDESRSISDNVRWSIQKNFQQGKPTINLQRMLGYDMGENGEWIINEEQAETVREIFSLYLCGMSSYKVANAMNEKEHFTVNGCKWNPAKILKILQNEKYMGDLEMQKNVTVDMLAHIVKKNTGEAPKYYIKNHHPAIIDRESWEQVQVMVQESKKKCPKENRTKTNGVIIFGNLVCGRNHHDRLCGCDWHRFRYSARTKDYTDDRCLKAHGLSSDGYEEGYFFGYAVWRCSANVKIDKKTGGGKVCPSDFLYECAMKQSFMEMIYRIKNDIEVNGEHAEIYRDFRKQSDRLSRQADIQSNKRLEEIDARISEVQEKIDIISSENDASLASIIADFQEQIKELEEEKTELEKAMEGRNANKENFDFFIKQALSLPSTAPDGTKMNINTVTMEYENKSENSNLDTFGHKISTAPDYLPFDKYFYHTFIKKGVVYGDEIEYTTCFGLKLKSRGNSRTMKSFLGFRRFDDGEYQLLKYTWQVIDNSIQYRRKKK